MNLSVNAIYSERHPHWGEDGSLDFSDGNSKGFGILRKPESIFALSISDVRGEESI